MKLRKARAIIRKASMTEWAAFKSSNAPNGWSARGGQGVNPYNSSVTPCGSSSGSTILVAANMAAVSLGSDTFGSILCPSSFNSVVGIRPTVGLTSRGGVVPISPRQDTIGWVYIVVGSVRFKNMLINDMVCVLILVPLLLDGNRPICRTVPDAVHFLDAIVGIDHNDHATIEMSNTDETSRVQTFQDIKEKLKKYGQDMLLKEEATNGFGNEWKAVLSKLQGLTKNGLENLMKKNKLDALVTGEEWVAPVLVIEGFPGIVLPTGYDQAGVPFGICFGGLRGSEPKLIEIAYAFEQATKIWKPPTLKFQ
ncbi:hypothetical protein FNV43_RR21708 [Rhamnella rubrinervis]|uniref:Amidase domain-containing protein n=1 Tax=Rhamnella rubrinervis TaxID=2594499 RepID=A0A8K0GRV4_9ROSA|nr:hypothetical protein FNV43_RR21708 [Rhamnella rubrinervis]